MLSHIVRFLRCPVCRAALRREGDSLRCGAGHAFDIARQGYVNLLAGAAGHRDVDTPAMVDARARFLRGGYYAPLADLLAARGEQIMSAAPAGTCVLDVGAGTGYYLARILDRCTGRPGIALDISKYAARRAARAHPRIGAVVADTWRPFPVQTGSAGLALVGFAPRNAAELHRVLSTDGRLLLVTPARQHLQEIIAPLGLLRIDESKAERLSARLDRWFAPAGEQELAGMLRLDRPALLALAMMGPSAWHVSADVLEQRIRRLAEPVDVTAAFTVTSHQART